MKSSLLPIVIIIHSDVCMIEAIGPQGFPEDAVDKVFRSFGHTRLLAGTSNVRLRPRDRQLTYELNPPASVGRSSGRKP